MKLSHNLISCELLGSRFISSCFIIIMNVTVKIFWICLINVSTHVWWFPYRGFPQIKFELTDIYFFLRLYLYISQVPQRKVILFILEKQFLKSETVRPIKPVLKGPSQNLDSTSERSQYSLDLYFMPALPNPFLLLLMQNQLQSMHHF